MNLIWLLFLVIVDLLLVIRNTLISSRSKIYLRLKPNTYLWITLWNSVVHLLHDLCVLLVFLGMLYFDKFKWYIVANVSFHGRTKHIEINYYVYEKLKNHFFHLLLVSVKAYIVDTLNNLLDPLPFSLHPLFSLWGYYIIMKELSVPLKSNKLVKL